MIRRSRVKILQYKPSALHVLVLIAVKMRREEGGFLAQKLVLLPLRRRRYSFRARTPCEADEAAITGVTSGCGASMQHIANKQASSPMSRVTGYVASLPRKVQFI